MKKIVLAAMLMAWSWLPNMTAQTHQDASYGYNVKYVRQHLFMQNDSDFNVVDVQLEWPETIDFTDVNGLQSYLAELLETSSTDADSVCDELTARYGQPVTKKLKALPDDKRFCYATYQVNLKAYQPNRYICFEVKSDVKPESRSSVKAESNYAVVTYDLQRKICLVASDIMKITRIKEGYVDPSFLEALFAPLDDDTFYSLTSQYLDAAWPEGNLMNFHLVCTTPETKLAYETSIPYDNLRYLVTKEGRRLFEGKATPHTPEFRPLPTVWKGEPIVSKTDSAAHFKGGVSALRDYMSHVVRPQNTDTTGRVILAVVIDKEGKAQDIRVVDHLSPELDRYAAKLIDDMPEYVPAKVNGQPVVSRIFIPINFKQPDHP